jgi:hypothetical protein
VSNPGEDYKQMARKELVDEFSVDMEFFPSKADCEEISYQLESYPKLEIVKPIFPPTHQEHSSVYLEVNR